MENSSRQIFYEENPFGAAMVIFPLTNKIKCKRADYFIHLRLKTHVERIECRSYGKV